MAETRKMTRTPKTSKAKPVDEYGHLQPQAPELEEAVLGALMIEKDAYSLVSEILRPESFYERRHQLIYSAITSLALRQQPVDILTVAEQLRSTGELEDGDGIPACSGCFLLFLIINMIGGTDFCNIVHLLCAKLHFNITSRTVIIKSNM